MKAYVDLGELPENERIALIAQAAHAGNKVGVVVNDAAAYERYKRKLLDYPVSVSDPLPSLTPDTVAFTVGPKQH